MQIFFCAEQLASNHKQWVWVKHYRRRISLQMPFALGRVQSGGQIGNFVLKVLWTLKGRLFNWLKNIFIWTLLKFTKFAFVYHCDWCHILASILGVCRMSVIWNLVYLLYLPRVSLSSIVEHRDYRPKGARFDYCWRTCFFFSSHLSRWLNKHN